MKTEPSLENRLRENSREVDLFHVAQEGISLNITSIQIPDGPWIDLEKGEHESDDDVLLSVRAHNRRSIGLDGKNQQIRFDFFHKRLHILLGDVFEAGSRGVPLTRDKLSLIWDSDTARDGQNREVPNEIRDAIADKILELMGMIMATNTTHRLNLEQVTDRRECSQAATRILYLTSDEKDRPTMA